MSSLAFKLPVRVEGGRGFRHRLVSADAELILVLDVATPDEARVIADSLNFHHGDVDVIDRFTLDERHQALHPLPWLVQHGNGLVLHFDNEDQACAYQRAWRRAHGMNPLTGERA